MMEAKADLDDTLKISIYIILKNNSNKEKDNSSLKKNVERL